MIDRHEGSLEVMMWVFIRTEKQTKVSFKIILFITYVKKVTTLEKSVSLNIKVFTKKIKRTVYEHLRPPMSVIVVCTVTGAEAYEQKVKE